MRILHSLENYLPSIGGMEVLVSGLAEAQVAAGHRVEVIATHQPEGTPDTEEIRGVVVHRVPARAALDTADPVGLLLGRKRYATLRESFRPDVTHLHLCGPTLVLALQTLDRAPCPMVATPHCPLPDRLAADDELTARLLRRAACAIGISDFMVASTRRYLGDDGPPLTRIYNGLPPLTLPPRTDPEPRTVLTVGRAIPEKGFDVVIRAFARVRDAHPDWRLRVAGGGAHLPELRALVDEHALTEAVELLGWVDPSAVPGLVADAAVFVAASRWQEPLGLTAIEAARGGLPVLVTDVGGLPETVANGQTGRVVPPDNPEALADALTEFMGDAPLRQRMGDAGKIFVQDRFDFDHFLDAHEALYASALKGH